MNAKSDCTRKAKLMAEKKSSKSKSAAKPYPEAIHQPAGKVAEGLATYTVRATPKPRAAARTIAGLKADQEVWAFVKANNLLPHLETAIQLARETFAEVSEIRLSYEPDLEIPFFNSVTIYVTAVGTVEELFEQEKRYTRAFVQAIPSEKRHQITLLVSIA
jgi:hypothetical protein